MEEGPEGGEAGQAGPSDAHLTAVPTIEAAAGDQNQPPAMSERTDSRAVRSSQRWAGAAPYVIVAVVAMWLSRSFWFPGRYVVGFDTYAYSGPNVEVTMPAQVPVEESSSWAIGRLHAAGIPVLGFALEGGRLSDAFLAVTEEA